MDMEGRKLEHGMLYAVLPDPEALILADYAMLDLAAHYAIALGICNVYYDGDRIIEVGHPSIPHRRAKRLIIQLIYTSNN